MTSEIGTLNFPDWTPETVERTIQTVQRLSSSPDPFITHYMTKGKYEKVRNAFWNIWETALLSNYQKFLQQLLEDKSIHSLRAKAGAIRVLTKDTDDENRTTFSQFKYGIEVSQSEQNSGSSKKRVYSRWKAAA